jgi:hypothetical protein
MRRLKILAALLAILSVPSLSRGTDVNIFPNGPIYSNLRSLVWGTSGSNGFNNNFFFTPINQTGSVCVYVYNNNPTNIHVFTGSITITANSQSTTPSDLSWTVAANNSKLTVASSPSVPAVFGAIIAGAAQVSINLSGSSTQAGNPDTSNVVIAQSSQASSCGTAAANMTSAGILSSSADQGVSDIAQSSFAAQFTFTNPGASKMINSLSAFTATAFAKKIYFKSVLVSCSAACDEQIFLITAPGTTCLSANVSNKNILFNSTNATASSQVSCTVDPTQSTLIYRLQIPAGQALLIPLDGFISPAQSGSGLEVFNVANIAAGTVSATFEWFEK